MKKLLQRYEKTIDKLTYRQCKEIISIVVISSAILMACLLFFGEYDKLPITTLLLSIFCGIGAVPSMLGLMTWSLLNAEWKKRMEDDIKIRTEVRKKFGLSQTEFVEVEYYPRKTSESLEITRALGVKYYAKENEELDGIIVIVKDAYGKEIEGEKKELYYTYFNENYKLKT